MNEHAFGGNPDKHKKAARRARKDTWDDDDQPSSDSARSPLSETGRQEKASSAEPSDPPQRRDPEETEEAPGYRGNGYRRVPVPLGSRHLAERMEARSPAPYAAAAEYASDPQENGFDLRKYLWLLYRHRWLILGCAALALVIGAFQTFLTTPMYRASATLQINREVPQVVESEFQQVEAGNSWEFYQTQFELLKSRSLAERVVAEASLHEDPLFMGSNVESIWTNLRHKIFGKPPLTMSSSGDVAVQQRSAAGRVMGGFSIQPVNDSNIVRISFESPGVLPDWAQIAEEVALIRQLLCVTMIAVMAAQSPSDSPRG